MLGLDISLLLIIWRQTASLTPLIYVTRFFFFFFFFFFFSLLLLLSFITPFPLSPSTFTMTSSLFSLWRTITTRWWYCRCYHAPLTIAFLTFFVSLSGSHIFTYISYLLSTYMSIRYWVSNLTTLKYASTYLQRLAWYFSLYYVLSFVILHIAIPFLLPRIHSLSHLYQFSFKIFSLYELNSIENMQLYVFRANVIHTHIYIYIYIYIYNWYLLAQMFHYLRPYIYIYIYIYIFIYIYILWVFIFLQSHILGPSSFLTCLGYASKKIPIVF